MKKINRGSLKPKKTIANKKAVFGLRDARISELNLKLKKENLDLAEQVRKFEQVVESVPNGIVIINAAGHIVLVNRQMEKMFGYTRQELLGKKVEKLVPERFRANHSAHREGFTKEPSVRPMGGGRDLFGVHKDGHEIPIEIGLNPIESEEEMLVLGSIIDVTKRKQLDDLKDNFLSTVSHELRTPLSILKMGIDNLEADRAWKLSQDEKEMVTMLQKNTDRLEKLINDLLDFSRLESGNIRFNPKTIDFMLIAKEVVENFSLPSKEKGVMIHIDCETPCKIVKADPELMIRVLTNLVNNALRYTNSQIVVCLKEVEGFLTVSVVDDGEGIGEQDMPALFNKFVQIKRPHGGAGYKGTGLGLAICREIVQMHQGKIWVESQLGFGTEFIFQIPMPSQ